MTAIEPQEHDNLPLYPFCASVSVVVFRQTKYSHSQTLLGQCKVDIACQYNQGKHMVRQNYPRSC